MDVTKRASALGLSRNEVLEMAAAYRVKQFNGKGDPISEPLISRKMFQDLLGGRSNEAFAVAFLDTRHKVIKLEVMFHGTIDGATVYPRVVAERALNLGAAAVILGHNHPSGVAEPSLADQAITRRIREALSLLDIRTLDHIIVGEGECVSMADRGLV